MEVSFQCIDHQSLLRDRRDIVNPIEEGNGQGQREQVIDQLERGSREVSGFGMEMMEDFRADAGQESHDAVGAGMLWSHIQNKEIIGYRDIHNSLLFMYNFHRITIAFHVINPRKTIQHSK